MGWWFGCSNYFMKHICSINVKTHKLICLYTIECYPSTYHLKNVHDKYDVDNRKCQDYVYIKWEYWSTTHGLNNRHCISIYIDFLSLYRLFIQHREGSNRSHKISVLIIWPVFQWVLNQSHSCLWLVNASASIDASWLIISSGWNMMTSSNGYIPDKRQWRGVLTFSLICTYNGWGNHRDTGDLIRHRLHYDVTIVKWTSEKHPLYNLTTTTSPMPQCTCPMPYNTPEHKCAHLCNEWCIMGHEAWWRGILGFLRFSYFCCAKQVRLLQLRFECINDK